MARRSPRGLRPDEQKLWQRVADTANPLNPPKLPGPDPVGDDTSDAVSPAPDAKTFKVNGHASAPRPKTTVSQAPLSGNETIRMDRKAFDRLKRGKLHPEAKLDLHGMTLAQAHPALIGFILSAHSSGKRLVLVITGKGKDRDDGNPIPVRRGILRHQVPDWLRQSPLGGVILQVAPAHIRHGGGGAYYVYLRRRAH